jgi:hypothetical protein
LIVVVVPRSAPRERRSVSSSRSSVSVAQERELRYREPGFLKVFSGVVANLLASAKRRVVVEAKKEVIHLPDHREEGRRGRREERPGCRREERTEQRHDAQEDREELRHPR